MTQSTATKDPALAAILSFLLPGLGQLYALRVGSFFAWLLGTVLAYVVLWPLGLVLHVVAIIHAFQSVRKPVMPIRTPTRSCARKQPAKDSKLFLAALVLVGILAGILIVAFPSIGGPDTPSGIPAVPMPRTYPWLNRCDAGCEQRLGTSRIQFIDEQTCETLVPMYHVERQENQSAWQAIIQDKAESLGCDGF